VWEQSPLGFLVSILESDFLAASYYSFILPNCFRFIKFLFTWWSLFAFSVIIIIPTIGQERKVLRFPLGQLLLAFNKCPASSWSRSYFVCQQLKKYAQINFLLFQQRQNLNQPSRGVEYVMSTGGRTGKGFTPPLGPLLLLFFGSAGHNCWPMSGNILTKARVSPSSPVCYECKLKVYKSNKFHLSCFNFTRLPLPLHLHSEIVANCWAFRQRIFNAKCTVPSLRRFIKISGKRHFAFSIWICWMHFLQQIGN